MPVTLEVAGMMGSGKSTLAKSLAQELGWDYVPRNTKAKAFLPDLFKDQARWAFSTQISFLVRKAIDIQESLRAGRSVVIDRSLAEDIEIFARYFREHHHIDERSFATYSALASHFQRELPSPWVRILCHCSLSEIERRLLLRPDGFHSLYPKGHVAHLFKMYESWRGAHSGDASVFEIDTERLDLRVAETIDIVIRDLELLSTAPHEAIQLSLFEQPKTPALHLKILAGNTGNVSYVPTLQRGLGKKKPRQSSVTEQPLTVYLAAPFSGMDTEPFKAKRTKNLPLFASNPDHGVIPDRRYRRALLKVESQLRSVGLSTIIPHRDVNQWGNRALDAKQGFKECTALVRSCKAMVAIIANSTGVHYELGYARGLGKPAIVVQCQELPASFIGSGIEKSDDLLIVQCERITDIPKQLSEPESIRFMDRFFR